MAQKYGFFNSVNSDRVYDASDVAKFLSKFFTNGVFNNTLQVTANDNMTVSVSTGSANINGYVYENTDTLTLDIDEADGTLNRIDSVVIRLDLTNRQITAMILEGEYANTPSQPNIVRSGSIYDLRLANILVETGTTRIITSLITDTRLSDDCGNVVSTVQYLSTEEIFVQYQKWFESWFANLQDQLDDNQAGHLQNEIDTTNTNANRLLTALGLATNTYDSTSTYAVGDLVIYNNAIYKCTTAIITAEEWNETNWELVNILTNKFINDNLISENIKKYFIPNILYDGTATSEATLSDTIANYKRLKIFVISSDNHRNTIEVYNNNATSIYATILLGSVTGTNPPTFYGKNGRIYINGNSLTIDRQSEIDVKNGTSSSVSNFTNAIRIVRVDGFYE